MDILEPGKLRELADLDDLPEPETPHRTDPMLQLHGPPAWISRALKLDINDDGSSEPEDFQARRDRLRAEAVRGTAKQRVRFLHEEVFIHTPDVRYVIQTVERLIDDARLLPNPGGLRIGAPGGMGKNALMRHFLLKYPPTGRGWRYRCPILHVDFRGYLAPKAVLKTLLKQLHAVHSGSQGLDDLEETALRAMRICKTAAIFFNEAQHLVPVTTKERHVTRLAGTAGDWLKGFLELVELPTIFLGVTGWDEVFELDGQLRTRVPHRYKFSSFEFNNVFIGALRMLDQAIPMPESAGLAEKTLARDIFDACEGNWRFLINLLSGALLQASRRDSPRIERADLSEAYGKQFGPSKKNPFGPGGAP